MFRQTEAFREISSRFPHLFFAAVLLLGSCNAAKDDAPLVAGAGTVKGRIESTSRAYVFVEGTNLATTTDADGQFLLPLTPKGEVVVEAQLRAEDGTLRRVRRSVDVENGKVVDVGDLTPAATGILRGSAKLKGRDRHSGTQIVLEGTLVTAETDESGSYEIRGVPSGGYTVAFLHAGYGVARKENVEATEGETVDVEGVELEPESDLSSREVYGSITGTVRDLDELPISGAHITTTPPMAQTISSEEGSYTLAGLFAKNTAVHYAREGYATRTLFVDVRAGQRTEADATLMPFGRANGGRPAFSDSAPAVTLTCPDSIRPGETVRLVAVARDGDGDRTTFSLFSATAGALSEVRDIAPDTAEVGYTAPSFAARAVISVSATDGRLSAPASCEILVTPNPKPLNACPIVSISGPTLAAPGALLNFHASVGDADGQPVSLRWSATGGSLWSPQGRSTPWMAPTTPGIYDLSACGTDGTCSSRSCGVIQVRVATAPEGNRPPTCSISGPTSASAHSVLSFTAAAFDEDGDTVSVSWRASGGRLSGATGPITTWTAADAPGSYILTCVARDGRGAEGTGQLGMSVTSPPAGKTCPAIAAFGQSIAPTGGRAIVYFTAADTNSLGETLTGTCEIPQGRYDTSRIYATGAADFDWKTPAVPGLYSFHCFTSNSVCARSAVHTVAVVPSAPLEVGVGCASKVVYQSETVRCNATSSEPAEFFWTSSSGVLSSTRGAEIQWTAPSCPSCGGSHVLAVAALGVNGKAGAAQQFVTVLSPNIAPDVVISGPTEVEAGRPISLTARATDPDDFPSPLTCAWGATGGVLASPSVCGEQKWIAPPVPGAYVVEVAAGDSDRVTTASMSILVTPPSANTRPTGSISGPVRLESGASAEFLCKGVDPDSKSLTFSWSSTTGSFAPDFAVPSAATAVTRWTAPNAAGTVEIACAIQDDANPPNRTLVHHAVAVTGLPSGAAYPCEDGTLAVYHFDETSGPLAYDACGEHHGTRQGGAIDQDSPIGRSYFFDGEDDGVKVADRLDPGPDSDLTIEAWFRIKCACPGDGFTLLSKGGSGRNTFALRVTGGQRVQFLLAPADGSPSITLTSVRAIGEEAWHHAAGTYDGRTARLYMDGDLETSAVVARSLSGKGLPLWIGATDSDEDGRADSLYFKGWIDEVRISDRVRTPDEFNVRRESRALRWAKSSGNPLLGASALWEIGGVGYPSVLKVSSNYLMFYQGGAVATTNIGQATSKNGIEWTRLPVPILGVGGSGEWDAGAVQLPTAYYDGSEYWLYYGGKAKFSDNTTKLGLAKSTNGLEFTKSASNPLLAPGAKDAWDEITAFPGSVVRERGEFRLYYTGYKSSDKTAGRIGLATSGDGVGWTRHASNPLIPPGDLGQFDELSAQNPRVVQIGAMWFLFYEGVKKSGATAVGLAVSLDGITWTKHASNPVLSADQTWEALGRVQAASPLIDGDQLKLYYAGLTTAGLKIGAAFEIPEAFIPGGRFVMGSDPEEGRPSERPEHVVRLSPYWMDRFETTNAAYGACVNAGPCTSPEGGKHSATHASYNGEPVWDNHPVILVTWAQADQYCRWAGKRLPTEAEWEKAARGPYPDERPYPWGDGEPSCWPANLIGCVGDTTVVGATPGGVSPFGIFDLAGNVAEWVNDWSSSGTYAVSPPRDPAGPSTGDLKVVRGGGWNDPDPKTSARVTFRDGSAASTGFATQSLGFRCARTP